MYEIDGRWEAYFAEIDPKKRLECLDAMEDQADGMMDFCRTLYRERYVDPRKKDRPVDNWLYKFVYFPGMYSRCGRKFGRGGLEREMRRSLKELHLEDPDALSEMERTVLYHEFRNAARRYLDTCRDPGYASRLMKLKPSTREEREELAMHEIWQICSGVPNALHVEKQMEIWREALYAELLLFAPDSEQGYAALEAKIGRQPPGKY